MYKKLPKHLEAERSREVSGEKGNKRRKVKDKLVDKLE